MTQQDVQARLPAAGAWVSAGAALYLSGAGLLAWWHYPFRLGDTGGVVSWVTVNAYPIQRERIALIAGIACVALGVALGQWVWPHAARALGRRAGLPEPAALRLTALALAGLCGSAVAILSGIWTAWSLLLAPLLFALALGGAALALRRVPPLSRILAAPLQPTALTTAAGSASGRAASRESRMRHARAVLVAGVVPLLLYGLLYDVHLILLAPIDTLHEGERLAHLTALRHGDVPYRDFFIQHGLGQDVLKAWLADACGDGTVAAQRLVERALRPLGAVALYLLGLALFRSTWTALLLALASTAGSLFVHDRLALGLLSVAAMVHAWRRTGRAEGSGNEGAAPRATVPDPVWTGLAGWLAALAFWYSTDVGLYAGAACALGCVAGGVRGPDARADAARALLRLAAGAAVGLLPVLVWLAREGALFDFVRNTWLQISLQGLVWGRPYPPIAEMLQTLRSPDALLSLVRSRTFEFYLPIAIVLGAFGVLAHRGMRGGSARDGRWPAILVVALFAAFLLLSALGRSDYRHLMYAMGPSHALAFAALEALLLGAWLRARRTPARGRAIARALPALLGTGLYAAWWLGMYDPVASHLARARGALSGGTWRPPEHPVAWAPLGAMPDRSGQVPHLREVSDAIREATRPGEHFYDFTNQAIYFFLSDRPSASRYVYVAYAATPAQEDEVVAELEARRTRLVLYRAGPPANQMDGVPIAQRHPRIDRYLRSSYRTFRRIGDTVLLQRADAAGAAPRVEP